jgi:hypothetical protein
MLNPFLQVSGVIAIGLVVLAAFHTYLMLCVRMGTYDWLLHRRGRCVNTNMRANEAVSVCAVDDAMS